MHESLVVLSSSPQPTYIAALAKFLRNMCQFPSKKMEIHGEILYKLAYLSPTAIIKVYGVTQENDTCCWLGILLLLCKAGTQYSWARITMTLL